MGAKSRNSMYPYFMTYYRTYMCYGPSTASTAIKLPSYWSDKQVIVPSDYLRNGQLIYMKAEPLEMRLTLNSTS